MFLAVVVYILHIKGFKLTPVKFTNSLNLLSISIYRQLQKSPGYIGKRESSHSINSSTKYQLHARIPGLGIKTPPRPQAADDFSRKTKNKNKTKQIRGLVKN